jgi:hypothetical protein
MAPPAPSLPAGPSAPGRSASRIASDRRGAIEYSPKTTFLIISLVAAPTSRSPHRAFLARGPIGTTCIGPSVDFPARLVVGVTVGRGTISRGVRVSLARSDRTAKQRHRRTLPYTPQTNGKSRALHPDAASRVGLPRPYVTSTERREALPARHRFVVKSADLQRFAIDLLTEVKHRPLT